MVTAEHTRHISVLADYLRQMAPEAAQPTAHQLTQQLTCADWIEGNFWIPIDNGRPRLMRLLEHQKIILYLFFSEYVAQELLGGNATNFQTCVFSTVKKSGKTALAAAIARWITETWGTHVETYALANDLEQARGRIYAAALMSIELDPRYQRSAKGIPETWRIIEREASYLPTFSRLRAVSSDYKGEAGSNPVATLWSELWGYATEASQRLWEELTPVPTRPRSIRYVETYAGYEGESSILNDLEDRVKDVQGGSRRLDLDELRHLLKGTTLSWPAEWESQQLPFYVHPQSRTIAYWDQGVEARRMPWQTPEYYIAQQSELRPQAFDRLHLNYRVSSVDQFIPPEWWQRLKLDDMPALDRTTPVVLGADASVTGDCTAICLISRDPKNSSNLLVRKSLVWQPVKGRPLDYTQTIEPAIRKWIADYNVVQIAYDEFQLHDLMTRIRNEGLAWCRKFGQQADRSVADKGLFDLIRDQRIHHDGTRELEEHITNCGAKVPVGDNTRLRLVKKADKSKIDLAVAVSMASNEALRLMLA